MFTLKFQLGGRSLIDTADTITILRDGNGAEITMHRTHGTDRRIDLGNYPSDHPNPVFARLIIENAAGKTTEILDYTMQFYSDGDVSRDARKLSCAEFTQSA